MKKEWDVENRFTKRHQWNEAWISKLVRTMLENIKLIPINHVLTIILSLLACFITWLTHQWAGVIAFKSVSRSFDCVCCSQVFLKIIRFPRRENKSKNQLSWCFEFARTDRKFCFGPQVLLLFIYTVSIWNLNRAWTC